MLLLTNLVDSGDGVLFAWALLFVSVLLTVKFGCFLFCVEVESLKGDLARSATVPRDPSSLSKGLVVSRAESFEE